MDIQFLLIILKYLKKSRQQRGPACSRRQERRRQEFNAQAINTVERGNDDDAETADNHSASVGITIPNIEVTEQVTGEATQHHFSSELGDYKAMITELKQTIVDLEKEIELKNETIAVESMLHDDFKERIRDKYLYSSNDELSDYTSDEERREHGRQEFWKTKIEARLHLIRKSSDKLTCKECGYISKSEPGLKTHIRKKH